MYMDDIKLIAKNTKELERLIRVVMNYSEDIGMEFSIQKYAMFIMKSGKKQMMEGVEFQLKKKSEQSEKRKITNTWEYGKQEPSNKQRINKNKKDNPRRTRKLRENQTIYQKSLEKDQHLGCSQRKILEIILKVDERK